MHDDSIFIKGAREHNLKNIDLALPRNKLIVITGLSGSGKSSLAFDTIYAEGQRRYVESLSAYARQFLGQMDKPDVDYIEGLSPAISIDQRGVSANPRSTVGTVTEIYDYLRLLFARIGIPHCHQCGRIISLMTVQQMTDQILAWPAGEKIQVLAPLVRGRKGEFQKLLDDVRRKGFVRARVDGRIRELSEKIVLEKYRQHSIEVVVDRLVLKDGLRQRLTDSLETTLALSGGTVLVEREGEKELLFSEKLSCPNCGISVEEMTPRFFSFNSPFGACPECMGLGRKMEIEPELVIPDPGKSLSEGAIAPWGRPVRNFRYQAMESWYWSRLKKVGKVFGFNFETPFEELTPLQKEVILYGSAGHPEAESLDFEYEGAVHNLQRRYRETESEFMRGEIGKYIADRSCPSCGGRRLKPEALSVLIGGKNIADVTDLSIRETDVFLSSLTLNDREKAIARQILKEIKARLKFLIDVGLDYLTLGRTAGTLSGGEAQRIRLATQIGSGLVGVLYILDEPTIGLHQRDNKRLLGTLRNLRDLGNTLLVVEHDEETIRTSDFIVDMGPEAGIHGGEIVYAGPPDDIGSAPRSITGRYLSGKASIPIPDERKAPDGRALEVVGARQNNLKNIRVRIPLGLFVCVTGVSGSGKSTLVNDIIHRSLARHFFRAMEQPGEHDRILGLEHLDKVVLIDQSPIGRTPRSNPATYTGVFTPIREVFSMTPEARMRGYAPGRFSFNVKGGRCEACGGEGILKIEMHFLPDVYVPCEECGGKRYNRETLEVLFKGRSIHDVLDMTVEESLEFFKNIPKIKRKLTTLNDVGLGYIHLGQSATTLSGGEAQRVKLATELSRTATGSTLYILDEPTTGLHFHDVSCLLTVLKRLVEQGNTVLIIEHNLDVIKCADYIIDLGPEGGDGGGRLVAEGNPEEVAANPDSFTGQFLSAVLRGKALVPARSS
ncbi:MAG: excinuclease ABC subunit UvrA [bacterium]